MLTLSCIVPTDQVWGEQAVPSAGDRHWWCLQVNAAAEEEEICCPERDEETWWLLLHHAGAEGPGHCAAWLVRPGQGGWKVSGVFFVFILSKNQITNTCLEWATGTWLGYCIYIFSKHTLNTVLVFVWGGGAYLLKCPVLAFLKSIYWYCKYLFCSHRRINIWLQVWMQVICASYIYGSFSWKLVKIVTEGKNSECEFFNAIIWK